MSIAPRAVGLTATSVLALLVAGGGLGAQQPAPDSAQAPGQPMQMQVPDSIRDKIAEFQKIQGRLNDLQQKAIQQSEKLQAEEDSLQQTVQDAMLAEDPNLEQNLDRMDSLRTQMDSARSSRDQEEMMRISSQAQKLRGELQDVQSQAMQKPAVQSQMQTFQDHLLAQMKSVDSETQDLIDRLQALTQEFQAYQNSQMQQSAPDSPPDDQGVAAPPDPPN